MAERKDRDVSLGDHNTFQGQIRPNIEDHETRSLGDQATVGGSGGVGDFQDDGMEVVDLVSRYRIEKTLGKGGMGEVLLATDTRLNRKVAIKRILGEAARNRTAVGRFLTEAQSIAALNHPNIVQIYDYGRAKDGPFLIMEFVEGNSLLDRCREGAMPLKEAIEIICHLCDGLGKAHEAGIIHRDIKPANVLMTQDGTPKLTDFGLAKAESAETGMTMAGSVLGTLDFMPPEQRRDAALADNRSDLWSLSATLYQIVTGESPKVIRINKVPLQLQRVLDKALEDSKEARYQTAKELRAALRDCLKAPQQEVLKVVADLGTGECPSCHTVNESQRKFCRECGDPLRCCCLKCQHEMPVWDKVCPECGCKQAELIASRLKDIEEQRQHAEQQRQEHQYQSALDIAQVIGTIDDRRLNQQQAWAIEFIKSTEAEWERQKELALNHFEEAKKQRVAFNLEIAISLIERIPHQMRDADVNLYLAELESDLHEKDKLLVTIRNQLKCRDLDGLLDLVNRAVKLDGQNAELQELQRKLRVREANLTKQRIQEGERTLSRMLQQMKGRAPSENEIISLLLVVHDCLANNSNNPKIRSLYDQLIQRLVTLPEKFLKLIPANVVSDLPLSTMRIFPSGTQLTNSQGMRFSIISPKVSTKNSLRDPVNPFAIGVYPVMQKEWQKITGKNPSRFPNPESPVETVSWIDANAFCVALSSLPEEIIRNRKYRLLSATEWEYACLAEDDDNILRSRDTDASKKAQSKKLSEANHANDSIANIWCAENSSGTTHPVGQMLPNEWGLFDMQGNVCEWVQDRKALEIAGNTAGEHTSPRVLCGGSWKHPLDQCLPNSQHFLFEEHQRSIAGFRLAFDL